MLRLDLVFLSLLQSPFHLRLLIIFINIEQALTYARIKILELLIQAPPQKERIR